MELVRCYLRGDGGDWWHDDRMENLVFYFHNFTIFSCIIISIRPIIESEGKKTFKH